jgi:sugar phosphate isomerase/epimerase
MSRKIGLAALTVLELSPQEQISVAAQAGYDCVGLRLIPSLSESRPHAIVEKEIAARLRDTGMKVLDIEIFRLQPETRVEDQEWAMAMGARFGAVDMLVAGDDPQETRLAERFARMCELAARHGLRANLEPMPWIAVSTVAKAKRIIELAGRPANGGVLADAIHFFRGQNIFADLRDVSLNYAQLCDARAEKPKQMEEIIRQARGDRLFPGEGGLDLRGLLQALPADLPISLEAPVSRKLEPLQRAKLALEATQRLLGSL